MKTKNNSNLPVVRKNHFTWQFKEKIKNFIVLGISLLGVAIPYMEGPDLPDIPKNLEDNHKTTINEIAEEDVDLKYEKAFSELGVKISKQTQPNAGEVERENKSETKMHVDDEPPEEKRGKDLIQRPAEKTHRPDPNGDELMRFYRSLKNNVNSDVKQYKDFKNRHIRNNLRDEI